MSKVGLKGYSFVSDAGMIAGVTAGTEKLSELDLAELGIKDPIAWEITGKLAETTKHPEWFDMRVDKTIKVRINPDLVQPPYWRISDCTFFVAKKIDQIKKLAENESLQFTPPLDGRAIAFSWWSEVEIVIVDLVERVNSWNNRTVAKPLIKESWLKQRRDRKRAKMVRQAKKRGRQ